MCDPVIWTIIGTTVLAGGQIAQGQAARKAGDANARIQTIMAEDALERGRAREASKRRETAARKGRQAAVFGASGAEINTGSSLEILADTAQFGELDALRIRNNAEKEAFGLMAGAAISRTQGKNAQTSSFLNAAGTLITGAAVVSSKWNVFKADNPGSSFGQFLGFGGGGSGSAAPSVLTTGAPN